MENQKITHSVESAESLVNFLKEKIPHNDFKLIGSLSKGKDVSENDIDVHIILGENSSKNFFLKLILKNHLEPESIENTDWGGWFFHKTKVYGNVDFFFDVSEFDYVKEVEQLLRDLFFEDWMEEEDWQDILNELLKQTGKSLKIMSDEIEIGVKNGYSVQQQLDIIKSVLR